MGFNPLHENQKIKSRIADGTYPGQFIWAEHTVLAVVYCIFRRIEIRRYNIGRGYAPLVFYMDAICEDTDGGKAENRYNIGLGNAPLVFYMDAICEDTDGGKAENRYNIGRGYAPLVFYMDAICEGTDGE